MDSFTLNKIEFDEVRRILCSYCGTSLGKAMAAHVSPSRNPPVIQRWLQQVEEMIRAIRDVGLLPFGGITDIAPQIARATPGGGASSEDFAAMAAALEGLGNLRKYLAALPEEMAELHQLNVGLADFDREVQAIRDVIGPDGLVADSASPRLGELRRDIASTSQQIHDVIYGYLRSGEVAKLLQDVHVTMHGDRYVLPVKSENRGRLPGVVHRASNTGATVFVEPTASVELNNKLADLKDDERREIERLLHTLSVRVSPRLPQMADSLRTAGQIDVISAKAQYAYEHDMTRPEVTERGFLQFTQARHPLLIQRAQREDRSGAPAERRHPVVPIDVRLGQDFDVLVVTGSNTGGKTVTLKTVALLSILAQSGMFIPAQRGATLPAFRDVFIDIGDEQSLQQSLSTFGGHMKRVRYILRKADRGCLVLLDELGSGTDPDEGGAIGQAILDELRHVACLAMITTHLGVLKAYAYNHERVDNASVEFDVQTLSPTYHLKIGTPGESHAISVAQKLGLPGRMIAAARKHLSDQGKQFRKAIQATSVARESAEQARSQAQAAELAALGQQETYQAKLADLHRLKGEIELWLARLGELKKGDEIFVPSLGRTATIARLELHRQVAVVDSQSLQVEVPLKELIPDMGQAAIREEINSMRRQVLDQARQGEQAREEARRLQEEFQRSLHQQKERARQLDMWLGQIARLKVGDDIAIARPPGRGKVVKVDMPAMRATVETDKGPMDLLLQELFPQTGPFARHFERPEHHGGPPRGDDRRRQGDRRPPPKGTASPAVAGAPGGVSGDHHRGGDGHAQGQHAQHEPESDRPMYRRSPDSRAARQNHEVLLATKPGEQVYVVPFHKRATLIRLVPDKDLAVVQSGIFEMELPLADLEPVRDEIPQKDKHQG